MNMQPIKTGNSFISTHTKVRKEKTQDEGYLILSVLDSIEKLMEHLVARKLSRDLKDTDIFLFVCF